MNDNLIQTKNILNYNRNTNPLRETNIPRFTNLFSETNYSKFRRDHDSFMNSLNNNNNYNNISTSLSSFEKNNPNYLNYNNPYRSSQSRSRSRSPCFCGCHSHEECANLVGGIVTMVPPRELLLQKYNNSLENMNQEMNKKNDDLIHEIVYLKKNLQKIETELNRTKNEKDACNYYIKELEKELNKSNMNNESVNSKQRAMNYSKMRDYEKYHSMLNKSFEVLDSVSNQCTNPKGKTKGGVNYYFNREKDYDSVIKTQKNWINNLPMSFDSNYNYNENEKEPNEQEQDDFNKTQSENNIYKYPEGYININSMKNNDFNRSTYNNQNSSLNYFMPKKSYNSTNGQKSTNFRSNSLPKKNYSNTNYNKSSHNKNNSTNYNKKRNSPYQTDFFQDHIMYKTSIRPKTSKNPNYRNNSEPNIPRKNNTYTYIPNTIKDGNDSMKNIPPKERYLVIDKFGNPIFISGKRLLAMELVPYLDKGGKEQIDNNGNILFIGPDGNPKTQDDLEPIILDNDKPLVNEENRPFLGVDNVIMVNRFGNPILGPGELYDINNKVVKGELGILPKTTQGNLIKLNVNGNNHNEPVNKNVENFNESIKNEPNNNMNYKTPKPRLNKTDKNINNNIEEPNSNDNNINILDNNNKSKTLPLTIRPLIGSDGFPIRDKNNNPILLDKDGNPIQDPNLKLLLDKSGFPILNTLGQPIILDKNKNPIELNDEINKNPSKQKEKQKKPEIKAKKINKPKSGKHRKKNKNKKNSNIDNEEKETGRFNDNYSSIKYPKPNPSFQRKIKVYPERSNRFNINEYLSSCFACDLGCSVSRSGYSPMTYSPYEKNRKRRDLTPYK